MIVSIPTRKSDYLPALTGLRFVLAVWVVLHHISGKGMMLGAFTDSLPAALQSLVHGGYLAVQSFFVLSGFVLARSYARSQWGKRDLVRYGVARIARIYPVYLMSLLIVSPFIFGTMMKPGRSGMEKAGLLVNYGLLLQGWTGNLGVGWNTPAWTLSCEFFFYLFFPLIFLWIQKARRPMLFAVLGVCIVTPVLLAHADVPWNWKPIHHFSDFAAGIAAAKLFEWMEPRLTKRGFLLYLPALVAGVLLIVYPWIMDGTYGDVNTGLRPLNAAALIGLALGGGFCARVLSSRAAQYLGKVSFSMYILHVPVLWWYGHWAMTGSWHMSGTVAAALYFAIIIPVSAVAFELVETPANRWIRSRAANAVRQPEPLVMRVAA